MPVWQPSMSRFDHGSGRVNASIPIRIVSSAPFEKNVLTASGDSPEARSARSTRSRQAPRTRLADLGVVARGPALEHQHQAVAVGHHRLVGVAHGVERLHPRLAARGVGEDLVEVVDRALRRREVELLLRAEEPEQVRLRDAGRPGDVVGRGAVEALDARTRASRRRAPPRGARRRSGVGASSSYGSEYSLTRDALVKRIAESHARQTNRASAAATRSHSASVIVVANGSASARAKARSAPGNEPRSR